MKHNQLDMLIALRSEKERQFLDTINTLKKEQVHNQELNTQIAEYKEKTDSLEMQIFALKEELDGVRNSVSWKITKPLRILRNFSKNLLKNKK